MEKQSTAGFWLSPQQKHIWSWQQPNRQQNAVCTVRLEGPVEEAGLRRALQQTISRHEILRSVFVRQSGMKVPFQVIRESLEPVWQTVDLRNLSPEEQNAKLEKIVRAAETSLNLESGPVVHATLAQLGSDLWKLVLSVPGLSSDFRSVQNLALEIGTIYAGDESKLNAEPLRYVQFAQWQSDLLESEDEAAKQARGSWAKLAGPDALAMPGEIRNPEQDAFDLQSVVLSMDPAELKTLQTVAEKSGVSAGDVLLSAWQYLVARLTGQTAFAIGVFLDGREYEELQDALGFIGKTLPVPARFDGDFRFSEVLQSVSAAAKQAVEWQEHYAPGECDLSIGFEYRELAAKQTCKDVAFRMERAFVVPEWTKLKLLGVHGDEGLRLEFHYDAARFARSSVERIACYFQILLASALQAPETVVSRLPLLPEAERRQLLIDWNQTAAPFPQDRCLHQLFAAQAARTPERIALVSGDQQLSYRQWNEQANQLAHYLRSLGVGPDALVGLCLDRSAAMMVALLAILKAGGAYVALNPDNPKPRLAQQLAGAVALITETRLLAQMPEFGGRTLCLGRDEQTWASQPVTNPDTPVTPENLVYVIYTSGSTGVPKGVGVRHRNLVNYSHFITRRLQLEKYPEGLHFATVSTLAADLGNTSIYPAMISGGCLHVVPYEVSTDAQRLARYTAQHPIDVLKIVPSHLEALLHSSEARQILPRKYLLTGGETLSPQLVEKILELDPACELFNHYGPTETTVGSLTLRLNDYDWKHASGHSIPIGRPIANTQVYILDGQRQPVPQGVIGELYIAGAGVTAGYLNQAEQTAERFVANPFVSDPQARMYRTGDLARYRADGNVEFLGRGDDQVKIRGFRIELGEIEAVLGKHAGVKQAVVLARADERGEKRLLGYVVARDASLTADTLRDYLKEQLPDYMVPQALLLLAKLPLNPNGKIDRQALPEPEQAETRAYVAPRTPTEELLANIWGEVLRRERVSAEDNFFDLGGHSLMATQIVSRIREKFRVELAMRILFEKPTILGLAQAIDAAQQEGGESTEPAIVRVARDAYRAKSS
jgi:amino acid adenylation domain-containing protein